MFYKKEKINEEIVWKTAKQIQFPDGTIINKDKIINRDGWVWYDEAPQEYLEWKKLEEEKLKELN